MRTLRGSSFASFGLVLVGACGIDQPVVNRPSNPPQIFALSAYEAPLGSLVQVFGTNFPNGAAGTSLRLAFDGTFVADGGTTVPVHATLPVRYVDGGTLYWDSLGPYVNPLSPSGDQVGVFTGTVGVQSVRADGSTTTDSQPLSTTFRVTPSILVRDLQPIDAMCAEPAARGLGGFVYRFRADAVGFTPRVFTYQLTAPAIAATPTAVRQVATGSSVQFNDLVLPPVPDDRVSYTAVITVDASDDTGRSYHSAFSLGVHRPIEVYYDGNFTVAQVMAPVPVSGCIPGGVNGFNAQYSESMTETRTRSFTTQWDQNWLTAHTAGTSTMTGVTQHELNAVDVTTTDGRTFDWHQDMATMVGATLHDNLNIAPSVLGVSLGGAMVGLDVTGSYTNSSGTGGSVSMTMGTDTHSEAGLDTTEATTDTTSDTTQRGGSIATGQGLDVASSTTETRGFSGTVIAGEYGVFYRQTLRLIRRANIVSYNKCGEAAVVATVNLDDWAWSPELAQGNACPPYPRSTLPAAQCVVPPCDG